MLEAAARLVRPEGLIVYSTCTLTLEENEKNVEWAIEELGLELEEAEPRVGAHGLLGFSRAIRLYPHIHYTKGFFIALLRKTRG